MVSRKFTVVACLALTLGLASTAPTAQAAYGYCYQPTAPTAFLSKPNKPYCAINRSCKQWEVDMYRNQVRTYYNNLQQYADDVDQYYRDAADYVDCMSDLD